MLFFCSNKDHVGALGGGHELDLFREGHGVGLLLQEVRGADLLLLPVHIGDAAVVGVEAKSRCHKPPILSKRSKGKRA